MPIDATTKPYAGWGRTASSLGHKQVASDADSLTAALESAGKRGLIARGLGRSYGDAAQNSGGMVLEMSGMNRITQFDEASGIVEVDAGISWDQLMRAVVPHGWFVPVTPGTRFVTAGGAIAADIHGKNHHLKGSLGPHLETIDLLTDSGVINLSSTKNPAEFWATVGGMGLTGLIASASLRLEKIPTSSIAMDTDRANDLDEVMAQMESSDANYGYTVAWVDCLARGKSLGRSVLTRGDFAQVEQLPFSKRHDPLIFSAKTRWAAPPWVPNGLLNSSTVKLFNSVWFLKAPKEERGRIVPLQAFFHPLDGLRGWNRMYGSKGFLQYQCVVPFSADGVLRWMLEELSRERVPSFLAVLKRFGNANPSPLSFAMEGWTLALDIPASRADVARLLDSFDVKVAEVGGRVYLAKDSRARAEILGQMYPRLDEWKQVRNKMDPNGRFQSDLGRRLGLLK